MTNYFIAIMRYNDVKMIVLVIFHLNIIFILIYTMYSHINVSMKKQIEVDGSLHLYKSI